MPKACATAGFSASLPLSFKFLQMQYTFKNISLSLSALLLVGCIATTGCHRKALPGSSIVLHKDLEYFDSSRLRKIPLALFYPAGSALQGLPVVIFSHGYGAGKGGDNMQYTYLTEHMARHGFFVASIQHELPADELMPLTGVPQVVRKPFWERGAANINYVLVMLKKQYPGLDYKRLTVMGHSNGGDMSALFTAQHPEAVQRLVTLDQRRYALPRTTLPRIYSLRSTDQPADEGVLPSAAEAQQYHMTIIKLPATNHNDMDNDASEAQRKEINDYILEFLQEK